MNAHRPGFVILRCVLLARIALPVLIALMFFGSVSHASGATVAASHEGHFDAEDLVWRATPTGLQPDHPLAYPLIQTDAPLVLAARGRAVLPAIREQRSSSRRMDRRRGPLVGFPLRSEVHR